MIGNRREVDVEAQNAGYNPNPNRLNIDQVGGSSTCYLKTVNLLLNGRPLQSLTAEPATEDESYAHYFQFLKTTGCVNSGIFSRFN